MSIRMKLWYPHANFTCVCCLGVENSVCIGDELQLPVQSGQNRTRQCHVLRSLPFNIDPVHCSSNIESPECCCQIYLLHHLNGFWGKKTTENVLNIKTGKWRCEAQWKPQNEEITTWFDLVSSLRPKPIETVQISMGIPTWDDYEGECSWRHNV